MSHIIMNIIPYDADYNFTFLEEKINIPHPVDNYFLKLNDLSINLLISLKWILWGHEFLFSISKELKSMNYTINDLINKAIQSPIPENIEKDHIILIDDEVVKNLEDTKNLIENFYKKNIFDENTKIHMKLKLNLKEYLIISEIHFPTFIKWDKIETY